MNFYSPDYIKKGIHGKGSGVLVRVLQRNKTNRVCLCVYVAVGGGGGRIVRWGQIYFKGLAQTVVENGNSEFYGAGKLARDRLGEALMLQFQSGGRIPSFLGDLFFFSLKVFNLLHEAHLHYGK